MTLTTLQCAHGGSPGHCSRCTEDAMKGLAKAAPALLPKCKHPSLHFDRGGFHIVCDEPTCRRVWQATQPSLNMTPDFMMMSGSLSQMDRRVDPMYVPPIPQPEKKRDSKSWAN